MDFYLQETPYSVYITIRKKFIKTFQHSKYLDVVDDSSEIENLKVENEKLRNEIIERKGETESSKDKALILQNRLEKAEKDLLKYSEEEKYKGLNLVKKLRWWTQ